MRVFLFSILILLAASYQAQAQLIKTTWTTGKRKDQSKSGKKGL